MSSCTRIGEQADSEQEHSHSGEAEGAQRSPVGEGGADAESGVVARQGETSGRVWTGLREGDRAALIRKECFLEKLGSGCSNVKGGYPK